MDVLPGPHGPIGHPGPHTEDRTDPDRLDELVARERSVPGVIYDRLELDCMWDIFEEDLAHGQSEALSIFDDDVEEQCRHEQHSRMVASSKRPSRATRRAFRRQQRTGTSRARRSPQSRRKTTTGSSDDSPPGSSDPAPERAGTLRRQTPGLGTWAATERLKLRLTFSLVHRATPGATGLMRRRLFDALPEALREQAWNDLGARIAARREAQS
jgi:hypothetical protein